jgi:hypothetical protein
MRQHGRTLQRKWLALFYLGTNPHQRILLPRFYSKLAKFGVMQLSPVPGSCKSNRLFSANEVAREEQ